VHRESPRGEIAIETIAVSQLGEVERVLWRGFRAADPALASPYFDLRFVEAASAVAPGARLAVIREDGAVRGFLPFQQRGGLLQPLAAPLSDFHGLVAAPGLSVATLLPRLAGVRRARFGGLVGAGEADLQGLSPRRAMAADLSQGFEAYLAGRDARFLKDKRRRRRALERDHGPLSFSFERPTPQQIDYVIAHKRAQIARTHQYDVFACGWTIELVHELAKVDAPDFGLRLAALKAGDTLVAAELGLTSGARHHLWFPIYDPAYAKYSPGGLMTVDTLETAAARGITRVDFGVDADAYKHDFADPAEIVFEGLVERRVSSRGRRMRRIGASRLARRFDRIVACEPGLVGQLRGGASFMAAMTRRHPGLGAGVGLGLGLGLGLAALMVD
jgi:CelD/BcsL family acetyltransferase involved in cellulose biosynthesis